VITVEVNMSDCSWGNVNHDGKRYETQGECDTAICGAVCCKISKWTGEVGAECEFLRPDLKCMFHVQDIHCKPISCLIWPMKPADVAKVQEMAERMGFSERCLLKVVEI